MNLPNDISTCHSLIKQQAAQLEEQAIQIQALAKALEELKNRLNKNSRNSDKPPSSDGLKKPSVKPAFPRKKGKKRGGQKGHQGKTLELVSSPDHIVELAPTQCRCGHQFSEAEQKAGKIAEIRQVFDLPEPKLEVTEHQRKVCICPNCLLEQSGQFPKDVPARVQYGHGVRALSVLLRVGNCMPVKKIKTLFSDLFGYAINEGTIEQNTKRCYEQLAQSEQVIKQRLIAQEVNHGDETGMRVAGKLHWFHVCCSLLLTYIFVHPNRGKEAIESEASILTKVKRFLVHDCWASYFNLKNCIHAICGAHVLRELTALQEQGSPWAIWFKRYFLTLLHLTRQNEGVLTAEQGLKAKQLFEKIWNNANELEPLPKKGKRGRPKATKGRNLLLRLQKHQDAVLAFAFHKEVPFTNNLAERDLRPIKTKQKVSTCFRTLEGAQKHARIYSFISTARKNQINIFKELKNAFQGETFLTNSS